MNRLLISSLLLLCYVTVSWAEDAHFTLSHNGAAGNKTTTVYAKLSFGDNGSNTNYDNWSYKREWEVAAFIDGECRAVNRGSVWNPADVDREDYYNYFPLEVQGNYGSTSDNSKTITFKVYNHKSGWEYNLKTSQTIRFDGVTHGSNTDLVALSAVELVNADMKDFEMTVNSMQDLGSRMDLAPSNATIPNNLEFRIEPSTYTLKVTGNGLYQFTPSAVGTYLVWCYYGTGDTDDASTGLRMLFREAKIKVNKQKNYVSGLSINSGYETIEVSEGDTDGLNDLLKKALKVSYFYPNEDPDEVPEWVSGNTRIIDKNGNGEWTPVKKGTCTMTAQVYDNSGNVRKSASLTVKVLSTETEDTYFTLSHNGAAGNKTTTVYAKLSFGDNGSNTNYDNWSYKREWEVAAFIDGECRAVNRGSEWNPADVDREDYYNYYPLAVQGNYGSTSDNNKTITFKVYNHKTGWEYNLTTSQTIKFDGGTHGSNTDLVALSAVELVNADMKDFEMTVNSTEDLASRIDPVPSNATIPNNLEFRIEPYTYTLDVTGDGGYQFMPYETGSYLVWCFYGTGDTDDAPTGLRMLFREAKITVTSETEDTYFTLSHDDTEDHKTTVVYAKLSFGDNGSNTNYDNWSYVREWEVAAFIDGECRAVNRGTEWNPADVDREDYYNFFPLEVQGNYGSTSDNNKTITFKVYNHKTGWEYNLTTSQAIKFDGRTYGNCTNLVALSAVELVNADMKDFEMTVNSTEDLASRIDPVPSNATIPNNLEFRIEPYTYTLDVTGDGGYQFTPYGIGSYLVWCFYGTGDTDDASTGLRMLFREAEITVTDVDNISSVEMADHKAKEIYDLQGRKVGAVTKARGVYIVNGKKVVR